MSSYTQTPSSSSFRLEDLQPDGVTSHRRRAVPRPRYSRGAIDQRNTPSRPSGIEAKTTPGRSLSSSLSKSLGRPSSSAYDQFDEQSWLTDLTSGIRNALQTSPPASPRARDRRRSDELLAGDQSMPSKLQELNEWARRSQLTKQAPTDAEMLDVRTVEDDPAHGIAKLLELDAKDQNEGDSVQALDLNSAAQELIALGGLVEDAGDLPLQLSDLIKKANGELGPTMGVEEEEEVEAPPMFQPRSNGFVPASSLFKPGASIEDVLRSRMEQAAESVAIEDEDEEEEQSGDALDDDEDLEQPEEPPIERTKPSLIQVIGDGDSGPGESDSEASDDEESEVEYADDQEEPIGTDDGDDEDAEEDEDAQEEDDGDDDDDDNDEDEEEEEASPAIAKAWHQQVQQHSRPATRVADDDVIEIMSSSEEEDEVQDDEGEEEADFEGEEGDQDYDEEEDVSGSFSTRQEEQAQDHEHDLLLGAEDEEEYDDEVESQEDFDMEAAQSLNPQQTQPMSTNEPQDFVQSSHGPNGFPDQQFDSQPFPTDFSGQGYFSDYLAEAAGPTPYSSARVPGFLQRDVSATHFGPLPENAPLESPAVQPAYDPQLFAQFAQQAVTSATDAPLQQQAQASTFQLPVDDTSAVEPLPPQELVPSASADPEPSAATSQPLSLDTTIAIRAATGALEGPGTSAGSVAPASAIEASEPVQQGATVAPTAANLTSAEDLIDFKAHAESIAQNLVGDSELSGPPSLSATDGGSVRKHPTTTEASAEASLRLDFDRPTLSSQAIERRLEPPLIDTPPGTPSGSLQPRNGMGLSLLKSRAAQLAKTNETAGSEVATAGDEDVSTRDQSMVEGAVDEAGPPQEPVEAEAGLLEDQSTVLQTESEPTLPEPSHLVASEIDQHEAKDEPLAPLQQITSDSTSAVADHQAVDVEDSAVEEKSAVLPDAVQSGEGEVLAEHEAAVIPATGEMEQSELEAKGPTGALAAAEPQVSTEEPPIAGDEAVQTSDPSTGADAALQIAETSAADREEEAEIAEEPEPSDQAEIEEVVQEASPSAAEDRSVDAVKLSAADDEEEALPSPDSAAEEPVVVIEESTDSEHSDSDDSVQLIGDGVDVSAPAVIEDMQSALDEAWPEETASGPVEAAQETGDAEDQISAQQTIEALAKALVQQEADQVLLEEATRLPFSEDKDESLQVLEREESPSEPSEPVEEPAVIPELAALLEAPAPSSTRDEGPLRSTAPGSRQDAVPSSGTSQVETEQPLVNRSLRSLRKELREHHRAQGEQTSSPSPSKAGLEIDSQDAAPALEEAVVLEKADEVPAVKTSPAKERQSSPTTPRKRHHPRKSGDPDQRDWLPEEHPERPPSARKRGNAESEAPVKRQKKHSSKEEHPGLDADLSLEVLEDEVEANEPELATIQETEVAAAAPEPATHAPHTRSRPKSPTLSPKVETSNVASSLFSSTPRRLSTSSTGRSYGKRPNRTTRAASQTVEETQMQDDDGASQEGEPDEAEDVEMGEASTPRRITRAQSQASSEMEDDGAVSSHQKTRAGNGMPSSSATRKRKGGAKARATSPTAAEIIVGTSGTSTGRVTRSARAKMEE